jgi:hypothetical protein
MHLRAAVVAIFVCAVALAPLLSAMASPAPGRHARESIRHSPSR